jgi:hypothetical protein
VVRFDRDWCDSTSRESDEKSPGHEGNFCIKKSGPKSPDPTIEIRFRSDFKHSAVGVPVVDNS